MHCPQARKTCLMRKRRLKERRRRGRERESEKEIEVALIICSVEGLLQEKNTSLTYKEKGRERERYYCEEPAVQVAANKCKSREQARDTEREKKEKK